MAYRYTYIVECRDRTYEFCNRVTYYVGGTNNPRQRISDHLAGKGAKYLRGREILRVAITMMRTEHEVKSWNHQRRADNLDMAFRDYRDGDYWRPFWHRTPEGGVFD
jgi:predicted GIY-YIG superfamily endonuclease